MKYTKTEVVEAFNKVNDSFLKALLKRFDYGASLGKLDFSAEKEASQDAESTAFETLCQAKKMAMDMAGEKEEVSDEV